MQRRADRQIGNNCSTFLEYEVTPRDHATVLINLLVLLSRVTMVNVGGALDMYNTDLFQKLLKSTRLLS